MAEIYKKIDDKTVEVTTIIPEDVSKEERDRAELQTELDHIPDRKEELQDQLDIVEKREAELTAILKVFD